jgi:hypothetical protein
MQRLNRRRAATGEAQHPRLAGASCRLHRQHGVQAAQAAADAEGSAQAAVGPLNAGQHLLLGEAHQRVGPRCSAVALAVAAQHCVAPQ